MKKRGKQLRVAIALFKKTDVNRDGSLDAKEVANSGISSLADADKDKDGKVSLKEIVEWSNKNAGKDKPK